MADAINDIAEDTMGIFGYVPDGMEWQLMVNGGAEDDFSALQVKVLDHYVVVIHSNGNDYDWYCSDTEPFGWFDEDLCFVKESHSDNTPRTYRMLIRQAGDVVNDYKHM